MDPKSIPAFPLKEPLTSDSEGMTLRDYFAAKAMQAHIAASFSSLAKAHQSNPDAINPVISKAAYETADAMLAAR